MCSVDVYYVKSGWYIICRDSCQITAELTLHVDYIDC